MLSGRIKVVTPPTIEPVTLAEALTHCHVSSDVEDDWFTATIKAAREAAENYQHRSYIEQTLELTFDCYPETPILLPLGPTVEDSVASIKIYDTADAETSLTLTDFFIDTDADPARISFNYGLTWPTTTLRNHSSVVIQYKAGYGTTAASVPYSVKEAMLLYIGHFYNNRAGEISEFPKAFHDLLRPDRLCA
jgi:uncharacterized phiE125 gp8 family phage protein